MTPSASFQRQNFFGRGAVGSFKGRQGPLDLRPRQADDTGLQVEQRLGQCSTAAEKVTRFSVLLLVLSPTTAAAIGSPMCCSGVTLLKGHWRTTVKPLATPGDALTRPAQPTVLNLGTAKIGQ